MKSWSPAVWPLFLHLFPAGAPEASADTARYYRVSSDHAALITQVDAQGYVTFATLTVPDSRVSSDHAALITQVNAQGYVTSATLTVPVDYRVEQSDARNEEWVPLLRGDHTGAVVAVKVFERNPPQGMKFIPGGRYTRGDVLNDHNGLTSIHAVYLSPFFIGISEVRNDEFCSVYQWAYDQGLIDVSGNGIFSTEGITNTLVALNQSASEIAVTAGAVSHPAGRGPHPAVYVTWYGAVAYGNFRSLMEGLDPCYDLSDASCDFSKNGYRLPTEAEWEYAARGGYEGNRFPWPHTNVITHADANYKSETNNWYDVSPTRGFHPDYEAVRPRTSPVGEFAPNNYGLYDICGNVWEWVWDWAARYPTETQHDPTGPETGTFRIFRGGSFYTTAERTTVAARYTSAGPDRAISDVGFRVALPYRP